MNEKLKEAFEAETGDKAIAMVQPYAGARYEPNGFSDEYVQWLENRLTQQQQPKPEASEDLTDYNLLAIALTSPALKHLSEHYPPNRRGKVPLKIKMACTVKDDLSHLSNMKQGLAAIKDNEYYVWCNSHGALSAILPDGEKLGVRPAEFEVTKWHS